MPRWVTAGFVSLITFDLILDGISVVSWIATALDSPSYVPTCSSFKCILNDNSHFKEAHHGHHDSRDSDSSSHTPFRCLLYLGIASVVHHIIYGSYAATRANRQFRDQRSRMMTQGGRKIMFVYFAGFGTAAEYVQLVHQSSGASIRKLLNAASLHAHGIAIPHLIMHPLALVCCYDGRVHHEANVITITTLSFISSLSSVILTRLVTLWMEDLLKQPASQANPQLIPTRHSSSNKSIPLSWNE
jgi:hypothetical protein